MTFFDLGDLVVVIIVLIAFIYFRSRDRNPHNLNQIMTNATNYLNERAKAIELLFDKRSQEFQDLATSLQAQQDNGVQILKRMEESYLLLEERYGMIDTWRSKIDELGRQLAAYGKGLELVKETFEKLQDDSKNINNLDLQLTSIIEESGDIQQRFSKLFGSLEAQAIENIKSVSQEQSEQQELIIDGIKDDLIEQKKEGFNLQEQLHNVLSTLSMAEQDFNNLSRQVKDSVYEASQSVILQSMDRFKEEAQQFYQDWNEAMHNTQEVKRQEIQLFENKIAAKERQLQSMEDEQEDLHKLESELNRQRAELNSQFVQDNEQLKSRQLKLSLMRKEILAALTKQRESIESSVKDFDAELQVRLEKLEDSTQEELHSVQRKLLQVLKEQEPELVEKLNDYGSNLSQKIISEVEEQLLEYKYSIYEYADKLHGFSDNVETIEIQHKKTLNDLSKSIEEKLAKAEEQALQRTEDKYNGLSTEASSIRQQMDIFNAEISTYKDRAVDTLKDKISDYDLNLFRDLNESKEELEQRLLDWKNELNEGLVKIEQQNYADREQLENRYKNDLSRFTSENISNVSIKLRELERTGTEVQKQLNNDMQASISRSKELLEQQFGKAASNIDSNVEDLVTRSRQLYERLERRSRELGDSISSQERRYEDQWQKWNKELQDEKEKLQYSWKSQYNDVKENISSDRSSLEKYINETSTRLQNQVENINKKIQTTTKDIDERLSDGLKTIELQSMKANTQLSRIGDENLNIFNEKLGSFEQQYNTIVHDLEDYKKNYDKEFTDSSFLVESRMAEIEKQQRGYLKQANLIDKAEDLRNRLSSEIESMVQQEVLIDGMQEQLKTLKNEFEYHNKNSIIVNEKLEQALENIKKINRVEEQVLKINNDIDRIDKYWNNIQGAEQNFEEMHTRLSDMQAFHERVEAQFADLEVQTEQIGQATLNIINNSDQAQNLEEQLDKLRTSISPIQDEVEQFNSMREQIMLQVGDVSTIMDRVENLDKIQEDIEDRSEKLENFRGWLARTETRMTELKQEIDGELKSMNTISKNKGNVPEARNLNIENDSLRETVLQLNDKGWKPKEIASKLKLSLGEVELIIEVQ